MDGDSGSGRVNLDISSSSIDEAQEVLSAGYNGSDFDARLTDRPFAWRHTASGDSSMNLRTTVYHASMRGVASPEHDYIVAWARDGHGIIDLDGARVPIMNRQPVVFPTDRPYRFDLSDMNMSLVHVDRQIVDRLAAEQSGGDPVPLSFDHATPPTAAGRQLFQDTIRHVASVVFSGGSPPTPLASAELARLAGMAMLTAFRHTALTSNDAPPLESRSIREAVDYIRAHADSPISTADIALEVGLSVRALQQAFRRRLDTTPTAMLRHVRLERVYDELTSPDQVTETVAEVARRWGFVHLGRFSAAYRDEFGEPPSTTLRSRR